MKNGNKTCKLDFNYLDRFVKNAGSDEPPESTSTTKVNLYAVNADDIACDSHPGFVRKSNEDSFLYCTRPDGLYSLVAVADGVGGLHRGAEASKMCLRILSEEWSAFLALNPDPDFKTVREFIRVAAENANRVIYERAFELKLPEHMCTTLAMIMFVDRNVLVLHAGDSRVYRLRDDRLLRLTNDHTYLAPLLEAGSISPEEARMHPYAHVISKSIGAEIQTIPDISEFDHLPGDRFLLCSDGLINHVDDPEIQNALASSYEPEQAVKILRDLALQRGGTDNITIICVFA